MPSILYSIGSSMVIILIFFFLIFSIAAYKVVVFPDPVGPVTKIIPFLFFKYLSTSLIFFSSIPKSFNKSLWFF